MSTDPTPLQVIAAVAPIVLAGAAALITLRYHDRLAEQERIRAEAAYDPAAEEPSFGCWPLVRDAICALFLGGLFLISIILLGGWGR
ncbi:MAG: hypothetical protein OJI67_07800 [Prosthecobacter sp.]|nr:hypothetical protein [Prosthecobacter sp.]